MQQAWAGVDIGKGHHHVMVIGPKGQRLLSRRIANDEADLLEVIATVLGLADEVTWAVDINSGGAVLLLALLVAHGQDVLYISSTMVHRASAGYRGEGKTDARDAAVIADQARMRRGLATLRMNDELIVELRMLVAHRQDLVADRTQVINRLREQLLSLCPALERALDSTKKGQLVLLTGYRRPRDLRELGSEGLAAWLRARKVRAAAAPAEKTVAAAASQHSTLPGELMASMLVAQLAATMISLNGQIEAIEKLIAERFHRHAHAAFIESMPGLGPLLGAEFLAATGGDVTVFPSADHLAGHAGLAPTPRDSGRISDNLHRPHRYNRALNRVFYTSALISIRHNPESKVFYDRKRSEGMRHTQAVLALARRRVNVLWAVIRDGRPYQLTAPTTGSW